MANGDLIKLGTLYISGTKKPRPAKPWTSDVAPAGAPSVGDIHGLNSSETVEIRNTDADEAYQIYWREVNDGTKKLLIADRNLLAYMNKSDFESRDLLYGKVISIDGKQYNLRSLSGGVNFRVSSGYLAGGNPTSNEWDRIIVNEAGFSGLPTPQPSDLDGSGGATDFNSAHNKFWNWYSMSSGTRDAYVNSANSQVFRGNNSARYWTYSTSTGRSWASGWRPVLEFLNTVPTLTLTSPTSNQTLAEGATFKISGSVSDPDGNTIVVKAKLNSGTDTTIYNSTNGNFSVTYNANQLLAGDNFVTFTADDGQGGIVTKQLKITNTPQPIKPYTLINENNFVINGALSIFGSGQTESYSPMTKKTYGIKDYIAEDQFIGSVGSPNIKGTLKLTMTRANTSMDKKIHQVMGAIE